MQPNTITRREYNGKFYMYVKNFRKNSYRIRNRIQNQLKSRMWIRKKSFRIHNTDTRYRTGIGTRYTNLACLHWSCFIYIGSYLYPPLLSLLCNRIRMREGEPESVFVTDADPKLWSSCTMDDLNGAEADFFYLSLSPVLRIRDVPGSELSPSRIPDPHQRI